MDLIAVQPFFQKIFLITSICNTDTTAIHLLQITIRKIRMIFPGIDPIFFCPLSVG